MQQVLKLACLLILFASPLSAQDKPFDLFEKRLREEPGGFAGNKEVLSTVFNAERVRLGDKFETELLTYLGNDVEKHYWISYFLEARSYLHGNQRLPHLALLLKQQALLLLRGKTDQESLGDVLRLSVTAAVLSEDLGLRVLSEAYKKDAEKLLASDSSYSGWFPGMDYYDRCLYDSIGKGKSAICSGEASRHQTRLRCPISGGMLDAKAVSKPEASYPHKAKAHRLSGVVTVPVVINELGVVEALLPGVKGHPLLQEAAINAANKARFSPTRLSGQPVKVCGVLTYRFEFKD